MAQAVDFNPPNRDLKEPLLNKLRSAPQEHVEALLSVYAILQLLQDNGILELVKGALGSGEKVLETITETAENDAVIRTLRNLVIFLKIIGSFEPEALEEILKSVTQSSENAGGKNPPSVPGILKKLLNPDSRRALAPMAAAIEALGRQMQGPKAKLKSRRKVTRHEA